mgnify:CR=1 FL=1
MKYVEKNPSECQYKQAEDLKARLDAVMREIMQKNESANPDILIAIQAIADPQKNHCSKKFWKP